MRIWTIQTADLYEKLKAKQVLLVDARYGWRDFKPAYHWMADQMRHRLPPSCARLPWWGWYRYAGVRRPKPDLRALGLLSAGLRGVRIELDLDDSGVLLSDFSGWHFVLNDSFLSHDEAESDQFDEEEKRVGWRYGTPRPEPLRSKVLASWERIFDFSTPERGWHGRFCTKAIQATFWELRLKDVTHMTFFTARG